MHGVRVAFAIGWAAFWLYWLVAAASTHRSRGRVQWSRELGIRAVIVVVVVALVRAGAFRHHGGSAGPWREAVGLVLFAAGLGAAIWARLHIGGNWGPPMTQRDEPELVTSGPYRFVLVAGIYFIYSATVEERFMSTQLPDAYPAYRRSTKMLIPFVF